MEKTPLSEDAVNGGSGAQASRRRGGRYRVRPGWGSGFVLAVAWVVAAWGGLVGSTQPLTVTALAPPVLWRRAEFVVGGVPPAGNPFNPQEVAVDATFRSASGKETKVPGFWYQGYRRALVGGQERLTTQGAPEWRLRWCPTETGDGSVSIEVRTNGVRFGEPVTVRFEVDAGTDIPRRRGYVQVVRGGLYLSTTTGDPAPLIGHCVCWHGQRGTYDYDDWFGAMGEAGENYARLWMAPWAFGLEAEPGTLNRYRLDRAWQLDRVFETAERGGIYLLLCLDYHGMFEVEPDYWGGNNYWPRHPYNTAQGGPCPDQRAFFTHGSAAELYQRRLRYLVARYGCSPNLLAWEFFNELDNVYRYLDAAEVAAWHARMGDWLHAADPFRHLVTTSLTGSSDRPEIWQLPQMDFAAFHAYGLPQPAGSLAAVAKSFVHRYGKPMMVGEFGTDWRGWSREQDPFLRGWRQGIWGGALGGAMGTSMSWWWENLHSENLYPLYRGLADFLGRTGWGRGSWHILGFEESGAPPPEVESLIAGGDPFNALLPLNPSWGAPVRGTLALADALSGSFANTYLSAFVHGSAHRDLRRPFTVDAWLGSAAQVVLHLNSVSDGARLAVLCDGQSRFATNLKNLDGKWEVNQEYNQDFNVPLPAGHHSITITNTGSDWCYLDWVRFDQVSPATYLNGWQPSPVAVGVQGDRESLLYVVSPHANFPANATNASLLTLKSASVIVTNLPAGPYQAVWADPRTGEDLAETLGHSDGSRLVLPLPPFTEDVAGRLRAVVPTTLNAPCYDASAGFEAALRGERERTYVIEFSPNLAAWSARLTLTNETGTTTFRDDSAAGQSGGFYRARLGR